MADKEARVIVAHGDLKVDQILTGAAAEAAIADGHADGHPSAVAYAKKLARKARRSAQPDDDE